MRHSFFSASFLGLFLFSTPALCENISLGQVVLRGLDKITGRLSTMTVNVGDKAQFGALDVYVRVCFTRPPEEMPENASFLEIVEKKPEGQLKLFSGWMFSSSPALSAMDHPVYDVWVIKCQGEKVTPPKPAPLILDNPIIVEQSLPNLKITVEDEPAVAESMPNEADVSKEGEEQENSGADSSAIADPEISIEEEIPAKKEAVNLLPAETEEETGIVGEPIEETVSSVQEEVIEAEPVAEPSSETAGQDETAGVSQQTPLLRPISEKEQTVQPDTLPEAIPEEMPEESDELSDEQIMD